MTDNEIVSWMKETPKTDIFNIMQAAAASYSELPVEIQKHGADLVLLELFIVCHEWKRRNGQMAIA